MKKIIFILVILLYLILENKLLIEYKVIKDINKPKISIFLAIYNKEKYLKRSIGSIQKQTLKELEIIAVNDGSTDNSLNILKEMRIKDSRIIIINNKKNRGSLYSRAIGILNSNGEYLLSLDPDDEYQGSNNLRYLYNKAKNLNVDVVNFIILYLPNRIKSEKFYNYNEIVKQPELFGKAFKKNILRDFYITNKLVKKEVFEKVYNFYKTYIYGEKWNYFEDNIWSILIYKFANSSVFINKNIYYYYLNNESVMMNRGNILELKNILFRNEIYKIIFNNKNLFKYLYAGYSELLDIFENNVNIIKENYHIQKMFINNINDLIKNYNIPIDLLKKINLFIKKIS